MLPAPAVFHFLWEITSGAVQEGATVRTYGRLLSYNPEDSQAVLVSQYASAEHKLFVNTAFVEPFHLLVGAQYIVLGELEKKDGNGAMVCARVLNCVEGVNLPLLQRAINEQRSYFQQRDSKDDILQPPP